MADLAKNGAEGVGDRLITCENVHPPRKHRPLQFSMFLKTLIGEHEMQRMMVQAIKAVRNRSE
jgi:hypothetical protein